MRCHRAEDADARKRPPIADDTPIVVYAGSYALQDDFDGIDVL